MRTTEYESEKLWGRLSDVDGHLFDPRPFIRKLSRPRTSMAEWRHLSRRLHYEGRVGTASYAAVPVLAKLRLTSKSSTLKGYALIGHIEIARILDKQSPVLPSWLKRDYKEALDAVAAKSLAAINDREHSKNTRVLLCLVALRRRLPVHALALLDYTPRELGSFFLEESDGI